MIDVSLDRLIADLSALVAIRSESPWDTQPRPGYREAELAAWLMDAMQQLGLETGEQEVSPGRPNIWGYRRGSGGGPTLMLAAHMDTVGVEGYQGDPFEPRIEDGRLHGRGSCDMKGAIASFLETVRVLEGVALKGDLLLLFVADEEHRMTGSTHAGKHGPSADFAIVGEPTRLAVCPKHKGEYCGSIVVRGKAAHTSMPERGRNAINDMLEVVGLINQYGERLKEGPAHELCGTGRCTVSTIKGGTEVSAVPDYCGIEFDRRMLPGEDVAKLMMEIDEILDTARQRRPGLDVKIGPYSLDAAPLDTAIDAPITQAAVRAIEGALGSKASIESFPGSTDAPNLGIPAVICGPGDLARAHTIDEWIELSDLLKSVEIYRRVAIDLLGG